MSQVYDVLNITNERPETNIVEHVTSRVKTAESTAAKLQRHGLEATEENAIMDLSDIVGVRLIVHFVGDIYRIRDMLVNSKRFRIVKEKDYVKSQKSTGYRGYHIIIETEIDHFMMRSEIQLRTIAMDCWASLEHQIRYKKDIENAELVHLELKKCADTLMAADESMENVYAIARLKDVVA